MTQFVDNTYGVYSPDTVFIKLDGNESVTIEYYGVVPLRLQRVHADRSRSLTRAEYIALLKHYALPGETVDDSGESVKIYGELVVR